MKLALIAWLGCMLCSVCACSDHGQVGEKVPCKANSPIRLITMHNDALVVVSVGATWESERFDPRSKPLIEIIGPQTRVAFKLSFYVSAAAETPTGIILADLFSNKLTRYDYASGAILKNSLTVYEETTSLAANSSGTLIAGCSMRSIFVCDSNLNLLRSMPNNRKFCTVNWAGTNLVLGGYSAILASVDENLNDYREIYEGKFITKYFCCDTERKSIFIIQRDDLVRLNMDSLEPRTILKSDQFLGPVFFINGKIWLGRGDCIQNIDADGNIISQLPSRFQLSTIFGSGNTLYAGIARGTVKRYDLSQINANPQGAPNRDSGGVGPKKTE
jgi:hypothetical protein